MGTLHRVVFGDCRNMKEIPDQSIHLMITSPPYYNAPFDYPGLFKDYDEFVGLLKDLGRELYRVLAPGRIACFVTDDMLVDGEKYPVVADLTKIMIEAGFRYRDRIVWLKPKGYVRISRRSGVVLQHPYPMYYYPDNISESILVFQKGRFNYSYLKTLSKNTVEGSKLDVSEYNAQDWYLASWQLTNVLPFRNRLEQGVAAFPEEIPKRLIKLYSFLGETVLDPFTGSGTTQKMARILGRNSWGYEIDLELNNVIKKKLGKIDGDRLVVQHRKDATRIRSSMRKRVKLERSVAPALAPSARVGR